MTSSNINETLISLPVAETRLCRFQHNYSAAPCWRVQIFMIRLMSDAVTFFYLLYRERRGPVPRLRVWRFIWF